MMTTDSTARTMVPRSGVAILTAALLGTFATVAVAPRRTLLGDLAIAGGYRCVEPRLSIDVPHAPFRSVAGEQHKELIRRSDPRLYAAAIAAIPRHDALVRLLLGDVAGAIKTFSDDGATSNAIDRSAAYYTRGLSSGSLTDFDLALQALSGTPDSAAVRFNRALILEQLLDHEAAAAEWKRYLSIDDSSGWAAEARKHLAADSKPSAAQGWRADKPRLIAAASAGNARRVRELVERYPLGARLAVQFELLPAGKTDAARRIVSVLAEKGEHLLRDAIVEIDTASPARRAALAQAYVAYADGHRAREDNDHERAIAFHTNALRLGDGFSAFSALVAEEIASVHYRQYGSGYAESQKLIEQTRQRYAAHRDDYIALFARLDWLTGLVQFAHGDTAATLALYERARAGYAKLGEVEYQAAQDFNIAATLDYLGESELAAVRLRDALTVAYDAEDPRRSYAITRFAADRAMEAGAPAAASAFQDRSVRLAKATGETLRIADAIVARSSIYSRAGRRNDALRDVAEANRLALRITDPSNRKHVQADASAAEAFALRAVNDRAVVRSLTRAIEFQRDLDAPMMLAQLLLERGRAYLRLGEPASAQDDFRAGVAELEYQRRLVRNADFRISYFDRAETLFSDLALVLLRRGQAEEAFNVLERARSRELLDRTSKRPMTPMTAAEIRAQLPANTVVVTYTLALSSTLGS